MSRHIPLEKQDIWELVLALPMPGQCDLGQAASPLWTPAACKRRPRVNNQSVGELPGGIPSAHPPLAGSVSAVIPPFSVTASMLVGPPPQALCTSHGALGCSLHPCASFKASPPRLVPLCSSTSHRNLFRVGEDLIREFRLLRHHWL